MAMYAEPFQRTVLIVDDDEDTRFAISRMVTRQGLRILTAGSAGEAEKQLSRYAIDMMFTDVNMETRRSGEKLLAHSSASYPLIPVIMMSCTMSSKKEHMFRSLGARECLEKPIFTDTCKAIIDRFCFKGLKR